MGFEAIVYNSGNQRAQDTSITTGIQFRYWDEYYIQTSYRLIFKYDTKTTGLDKFKLALSSFSNNKVGITTETYPDILLFVAWTNSVLTIDYYYEPYYSYNYYYGYWNSYTYWYPDNHTPFYFGG